MIKEEDLHKIGLLTKPHGVKGEISLVTDFDLDDISGDPCIVCDIDGIWTPFFIHSYRLKNASTTLVTLDYLDSPDKVDFLKGKTAFVPIHLIPGLKPADSQSSGLTAGQADDLTVLQPDITGYTLVDERHGTIGQVKIIDDRTLNILLTVDYKGNEILIPLALATSIQHSDKTINLSLPDGFLEI